MSRKTAREVAFKLCYSRLMGGENEYGYVLEQSDSSAKPCEEDCTFAKDVAQGVAAYQNELDALISKNAIGWALDRMPKVDLCILRIAIYEMLYREDISHSVSINEAVELSKKYSGEKSPAFINGLLGTVSKQLQETAPAPS